MSRLSSALAAFWMGALSVAACDTTVVGPDGSGGATSSSGGGGGHAGMSCHELETEYLKEFEKARVCQPEMSVEQCTTQVDHELPCPCPRFVNPANSVAMGHLQQLRAAWGSVGCTAPPCDAGLCPLADGGACVPTSPGSSVSGLCEDNH